MPNRRYSNILPPHPLPGDTTIWLEVTFPNETSLDKLREDIFNAKSTGQLIANFSQGGLCSVIFSAKETRKVSVDKTDV